MLFAQTENGKMQFTQTENQMGKFTFLPPQMKLITSIINTTCRTEKSCRFEISPGPLARSRSPVAARYA